MTVRAVFSIGMMLFIGGAAFAQQPYSFRKVGDGSPVVLLHGLSSSSAAWSGQVGVLAQHHTVYTVDFPGHGQTTASAGGHSIKAYADGIHAFMTKEGIQEAVLAGHSLGGMVALQYAADERSKGHIRAVVAVDSVPGLAFQSDDQKADFIAKSKDSPIDVLKQLYSSASIDPDRVASLKAEGVKISPDVLRELLFDIADADLRPILGKIDVPVLLMFQSMGRPEETTVDMVERRGWDAVKTLAVERFENAGHFLMLDAPRQVNDLLTAVADDRYPFVEGAVKLPSGLAYRDEKVGTGETPPAEAIVKIHYDMRLMDGGTVDSSLHRGRPLTTPLSRLNRGFREGVAGMRAGGRRVLTIPPELAFGAIGLGGLVPPDATIQITVDLLSFELPEGPPVMPDWKSLDMTTTESGLLVYDVKEGDGFFPNDESIPTIHFTLFLSDGKIVYSTKLEGPPLRRQISKIPDEWVREALLGMKAGGHRIAVAKPEIAFGEVGQPPHIPPNATLVFDVEMIGFDAPPGPELYYPTYYQEPEEDGQE